MDPVLCPCCGTEMAIKDEGDQKVSLECPACHLGEIRLKA